MKRCANVRSRRVQVDEVWSFTAAKQKNVARMKKPVEGAGDTWTWTALDADSKLIVQWFVGARDGYTASLFIQDLASRLANSRAAHERRVAGLPRSGRRRFRRRRGLCPAREALRPGAGCENALQPSGVHRLPKTA